MIFFSLPYRLNYFNCSQYSERNYVLVALTSLGEILLSEDDGSRRGLFFLFDHKCVFFNTVMNSDSFVEHCGSAVIYSLLKNPDVNSKGTFMDGRRHWISYHRNIDNIEYMVTFTSTDYFETLFLHIIFHYPCFRFNFGILRSMVKL